MRNVKRALHMPIEGKYLFISMLLAQCLLTTAYEIQMFNRYILLQCDWRVYFVYSQSRLNLNTVTFRTAVDSPIKNIFFLSFWQKIYIFYRRHWFNWVMSSALVPEL